MKSSVDWKRLKLGVVVIHMNKFDNHKINYLVGNKSIKESIKHCRENTFHAVIKTTLVIVVSLLPLLFSQFTSISQLASITITAAIIALVFDILLLPILLAKYIR